MNKKGQIFEFTQKTIFWMMAGVIITAIVFTFAFMIANYKDKLMDVSLQLRAETIALRFTNIPECFAYQDPETGRVYPKVIDLSKFNDEQMVQCYFTDPEREYRDYHFGLTLENERLFVSTNKYVVVENFVIYKNVFVKDEGGLREDRLKISVQKEIQK